MTFQVTIMFGLGFMSFFASHFKFCRVIFSMTDLVKYCFLLLAAILNWNYRLQNSNFKFQRSEVLTELLYFYVDRYMFVK